MGLTSNEFQVGKGTAMEDVAEYEVKNESFQTLQPLHPYTTRQEPDYLKYGWRATKGPHAENQSGFRAVGHRVLLKPEVVEKKTASGIFLPEKTVNAEEQRAVIATVLEIGNDCWTDKASDYCEVGDRVLIGQYVGKFHESPVDGQVYRFVMDTDIISPLPKK